MIVDTPDPEGYDVVIIGSGPAGISAGLRIAAQSRARIAIVESGELEPDESVQEFSRVSTDGDLDPGYFSVHSQRRFGGTSSVWAGWCATLEKRAFSSGEWPLSYEKIDHYYADAAEILELPADVYLKREVPIDGSSNIIYKPYFLSPPVRFGEKYQSVLEQHQSVDLILNRTCNFLTSQGGVISEALLVESRNLTADPVSLRAGVFVLACGGVGNARLLQLSGLASRSPVGRYFMDHPHLYGASSFYLNEPLIRPYLNEGHDVVHALQLTSDFCQEQGILSFGVQFNLDEIQERPLLGESSALILSRVNIRAEMVPSYTNSVTTNASADELDSAGNAISHVSFRFGFDEQAQKIWRAFSEELLRSGLGRPAILSEELSVTGGGHLMGTTRMGLHESESVVDVNCKVHGIDNLFVAGSSVFPAGGAANPTFTIVALALRLGDHVAQLTGGSIDE